MITKTLKEGEQLTEILAEKKATWDRSSEHFASRVAELKEAAESLAFTHEKLSNALLLKESENENLAMLETQTREDREKELSALKTRIDEMTGVTGELHKRLTANYETIREQVPMGGETKPLLVFGAPPLPTHAHSWLGVLSERLPG